MHVQYLIYVKWLNCSLKMVLRFYVKPDIKLDIFNVWTGQHNVLISNYTKMLPLTLYFMKTRVNEENKMSH